MAASLLRRKAGSLFRLSIESVSKRNYGRLGVKGGYLEKILLEPSYIGRTRCLSTVVDVKPTDKHLKKNEDGGVVVAPEENLPNEEDLYKERYIPITRRSIIRRLVEKEQFLNDEEKRKFTDLALALDSAIVNKYHGILQELKNLFDPINPDKDTIKTRTLSRREKLDNEFWLLEKLADIMEKANFHELSDSTVKWSLAEHEAREGVRVSVNPTKYDVLRYWALGKEKPEKEISFMEKLRSKILRQPPRRPLEYYKRVVVAIRLKKDMKLMLKAFKEVPVNALEMLLPDGTIKMNTTDKGILVTSGVIAGVGIIAKLVTVLADLNVDWMLIFTAVMGTIGVRSWTVYKNRRNAYLVDVSRTLYFKNIANNRGLLTLLVDRAEDESFKEALLTYTFLLTQRSALTNLRESKLQSSADLGGLTTLQLEKMVENWIETTTGVKLEFDSTEAITLLKQFGLLHERGDKLHVQSIHSALSYLPLSPQTIVARAREADIGEGYDRDIYLETEEEYKEEDKKSKSIGWF
ncbi:hypothetical protein LOTGIDRAFT_231385 [Lottia gigantea]|uniref:Transmembrane protein 143 n=1 Tax=Lottia gigantea TaxID=225164 RepID=V4ATR3_LOTGI|nr:hypothetical protein LOTGIDRAFT_231385 [Lottia gigantea]ESO98305.1 hypothetical protein LOTGIDRAFT_231385 [Lottia gigantea]